MATFRHITTGKRLLFIHIPRTAGRFVENNLMVNNEFEWSDDREKLGIERMFQSVDGPEGEIELAHFHRAYYEKYLDCEDIPHVSIIRNPLKRFISASIYINRVYGMANDTGEYTEESLQECQELMEDENYFYPMLSNFPFDESKNWYRSQLDFLSDKTHVWRFEDGFTEEFSSWLSEIIGVKVEMKEETEYWSQPDQGHRLKPTSKLLRNVRNLYRKEIEKFYPDI